MPVPANDENIDLTFNPNSAEGEPKPLPAFDVTQPSDEQQCTLQTAYSFSSNFFSEHFKSVLKKWDITYVDSLEQHKNDIENRLNLLSEIYTNIARFPCYNGVPQWESYKGVVISDTKKRVLATSKYVNKNDNDSTPSILLWNIILESIKKGCNDKNISLSEVGDSTAAKVLTIQSPIGSYKNRLLQYIYLYLCIKPQLKVEEKNILPIYINAAMAEDDQNQFNEYLKQLEKMLKILNRDEAIPLLIIDNVRLFQCGVNNIYTTINGIAIEQECKIVVGADNLYSWNEKRASSPNDERNNLSFGRKFPLYYKNTDGKWQFTEGSVINISSINLLGRKDESIDFIEACLSYFKVEKDFTNQINATDLYNILIGKNREQNAIMSADHPFKADLQFYCLDAYLLRRILPALRDFTGDALNLVGLYDEVFFDGTSPDAGTSRNAYLYEYDDEELIFDKWWKVAKEHRSVLDYLIAQHYWKLLSAIIKNPEESDFSKLPAKVVLPKNVTRFLVQRMNSDPAYIRDTIDKFEKFYNGLSPEDYCKKSEMAYLLGRINIKNSDQKRKQIRLLNKILNKEDSLLKKLEGDVEKKKQLFLLRTINVSLIYLADENAFCDYINNIILSDADDGKLSQEINCGFHLEYYGDVASFWSGETFPVTLEDNPNKGINTFRKLFSDMNNRFNVIQGTINIKKLYILTLQIVTFNSLIKERCERNGITKVSDSEDFKKQCLELNLRFLELISNEAVKNSLKEQTITCLNNVRTFILNNSQKLLFNKSNPSIDINYFNNINMALNTIRTGWEKRGIFKDESNLNHKGFCPESISAHMYQCWLIGYIFLPQTYFEESYNKKTILDILLIHDLGETQTGDISAGTKTEEHKEEEKNALKNILSVAKDQNAEGKIELWKKSENLTNETNINARIAKEIDKIQALYQYCCYCINGQIEYDSLEWKQMERSGENKRYWRNEIENMVQSEIGKGILWALVLNNKYITASQKEGLVSAINEWREEFIEKALKDWA